MSAAAKNSHIVRRIFTLVAILCCVLSMWAGVQSELMLAIVNQLSKASSGAHTLPEADVSWWLVLATAITYVLSIIFVGLPIRLMRWLLMITVVGSVPAVTIFAALLTQEVALNR